MSRNVSVFWSVSATLWRTLPSWTGIATRLCLESCLKSRHCESGQKTGPYFRQDCVWNPDRQDKRHYSVWNLDRQNNRHSDGQNCVSESVWDLDLQDCGQLSVWNLDTQSPPRAMDRIEYRKLSVKQARFVSGWVRSVTQTVWRVGEETEKSPPGEPRDCLSQGPPGGGTSSVPARCPHSV